MAPAAKDVTTPTETETLDIAIERGKSGGFGIAIMAGSNGGAYVEYVQDMAKEQNVIKPGDHITHVEGEGPLTNGVVMEKLRAGGAKVGLRVIRGEKIKRKEAGSSSRWATVFAIVAGVAAIATSVWPPEQWFSDLSLSGSTVMSVRDILSDDDEKPRERGPVIKIAGQMFTLEADGSAANPDEVRAAMRSDASMMGQIRKNEPMWAATVAGRPDGTYDVDKFQKMMRRKFVSFTTHQATKLNEDGTAVDPAAYLKMALKDKKWVGQVKKMSDTQLKERILKGEPEGLQQMLRGQRARDEAQKAADEAPPPPPTPYDEMGQVDMSFRILTDEGEEKDLYSLRPKMVEEERWQLPVTRCIRACVRAVQCSAVRACSSRVMRACMHCVRWWRKRSASCRWGLTVEPGPHTGRRTRAFSSLGVSHGQAMAMHAPCAPCDVVTGRVLVSPAPHAVCGVRGRCSSGRARCLRRPQGDA